MAPINRLPSTFVALGARRRGQQPQGDYTVVDGDTMSSIALRLAKTSGASTQATLKSLIAANPHITNPNRIYPGDQIVYPGRNQPQPTNQPSGEGPWGPNANGGQVEPTGQVSTDRLPVEQPVSGSPGQNPGSNTQTTATPPANAALTPQQHAALQMANLAAANAAKVQNARLQLDSMVAALRKNPDLQKNVEGINQRLQQILQDAPEVAGSPSAQLLQSVVASGGAEPSLATKPPPANNATAEKGPTGILTPHLTPDENKKLQAKLDNFAAEIQKDPKLKADLRRMDAVVSVLAITAPATLESKSGRELRAIIDTQRAGGTLPADGKVPTSAAEHQLLQKFADEALDRVNKGQGDLGTVQVILGRATLYAPDILESGSGQALRQMYNEAVETKLAQQGNASTASASAQTDSSTVSTAPVNAAPVNAAPVNAAPVNAAPVNAAPVNAPINVAPVNAAAVDTSASSTPAAESKGTLSAAAQAEVAEYRTSMASRLDVIATELKGAKSLTASEYQNLAAIISETQTQAPDLLQQGNGKLVADFFNQLAAPGGPAAAKPATSSLDLPADVRQKYIDSLDKAAANSTPDAKQAQEMKALLSEVASKANDLLQRESSKLIMQRLNIAVSTNPNGSVSAQSTDGKFSQTVAPGAQGSINGVPVQ